MRAVLNQAVEVGLLRFQGQRKRREPRVEWSTSDWVTKERLRAQARFVIRLARTGVRQRSSGTMMGTKIKGPWSLGRALNQPVGSGWSGRMATIIDGYNVLYVVGILAPRIAPGTLERARQALLNFVVATMEWEQRKRTTVVFDAHDPPPGAQSVYEYKGIMVRFAVRHSSADALIEELVYRESAPRSLVVVSSDRRIQQVAKRRRARAVDSETWYDEQQRLRPNLGPLVLEEEPQRYQGTELGQVDFWLAEFGLPPKAALPSAAQPVAEDRDATSENPQPESRHGRLDPALARGQGSTLVPSQTSASRAAVPPIGSRPLAAVGQPDQKVTPPLENKHEPPTTVAVVPDRQPTSIGPAASKAMLDLSQTTWDESPFSADYLAACEALVKSLENTRLEPPPGAAPNSKSIRTQVRKRRRADEG